MKKFLLASVFFLCSIVLQAQSDFFQKADGFLKKYVASGKVDYATIKANPQALNELVTLIENYKTSGKSANELKAFYLNAYNISTIHGIIKKYPIDKPTNIDGFFDKQTHQIAGKSTTLNDLENKIIRPTYKDARIHFALVCAANGCPKIGNFAFMPSKVESQLEAQTKKAMNDKYFIRVDAGKKQVLYSQIFDWYKADFLAEAKSVVEFINKYRTSPIGSDYKAGTYEYDWTLNKK